jgi:hypothetical protein
VAENLDLLGFVDLEPAPGVPVASFPLEGAESAQESRPVGEGLDGHHPIEELGDPRGARAGNELIRDSSEHRKTVVVEKAKKRLHLPARLLRAPVSGGTGGGHGPRDTGGQTLEHIAATDPDG